MKKVLAWMILAGFVLALLGAVYLLGGWGAIGKAFAILAIGGVAFLTLGWALDQLD